MNKILLEAYSDFLIFNQGLAASTIFSEATEGLIGHDQFTRFLNYRDYTQKDLWKLSKPIAKKIENGVLALDDSISEKPYSKQTEVNCWHYSHMKGRCVKGIEILTALLVGEDLNLPVGYEVTTKPIEFCDLKTKQEKRKSVKSKNTLARALIQDSLDKCLSFDYITADSWFCCGETLNYIQEKSKKYIFGIKSNRKLFLTIKDREKDEGKKLSEVDLKDDILTPFFINKVDHQVFIMKKSFTNGDGSTGVLYLVTNEGTLSGLDLYSIYHKRWAIEVFHKSIKNNTSLSRSPAWKSRSQKNHIFCSLYAYIKLERVKVQEKTNQFHLKRDIQIHMLKSCRKYYENKFKLIA